MLFIHELFLCCWFSGPVLPHFRLVLAISRVIKIKLTNSCKRKAVAWSSLEGTQRGEIADIKYWLATLESLGPWKGRPWGPYTEVHEASQHVSSGQLAEITEYRNLGFYFSMICWWQRGERLKRNELLIFQFVQRMNFKCLKELCWWGKLRNISMGEGKNILVPNILTTE